MFFLFKIRYNNFFFCYTIRIRLTWDHWKIILRDSLPFFFAKNNKNANFRKILKCAQKIFKLESEMQKS